MLLKAKPRRRIRWRNLVPFLAAALATAGCSAEAPPDASAEAGSRNGATSDVDLAQVTEPEPVLAALPFGPYFEASDAYHVSIDRVLARHVAPCMRQRGFEFVEPEVPDRDPYSMHDMRFGFLSEDGNGAAAELDVQTHEDGDAHDHAEEGSASEDDGRLDPNSPEDPDQEAAYNAALYGAGTSGTVPLSETEDGVPSVLYYEPDQDGCFGQAARAINYASLLEPGSRLQDLAAQIVAARNNDPAVVEATQRWSSCMADRGYQLGHPSYVSDLLAELGQFDPAMVAGDVACKTESEWMTAVIAAERRLQQEALENEPDLLTLFDEAETKLAELL